MTIYVEGTSQGYRITMPNGEREHIPGEKWQIAQRKDALNLLEKVYGFARKNIRFYLK